MPLSPRGLPRGSAALSCVLRRRPAAAHRATSGRTREPRPAPPSRVKRFSWLRLGPRHLLALVLRSDRRSRSARSARHVLADARDGAHEELSAVSPTLEAPHVPPNLRAVRSTRLAARGIADGTAAPFLERREPPALRSESPATRWADAGRLTGRRLLRTGWSSLAEVAAPSALVRRPDGHRPHAALATAPFESGSDTPVTCG
jgi:hypothetical protein